MIQIHFISNNRWNCYYGIVRFGGVIVNWYDPLPRTSTSTQPCFERVRCNAKRSMNRSRKRNSAPVMERTSIDDGVFQVDMKMPGFKDNIKDWHDSADNVHVVSSTGEMGWNCFELWRSNGCDVISWMLHLEWMLLAVHYSWKKWIVS